MRDLRFNQGFSLNRERLAGMVRCIHEGEATSNESVGAYIGVNPYMVEGIRGWLWKTGLGRGTSKSYELSSLGSIISTYDPDLRQPTTLWLLHYNLCSLASGERSEVWYRSFNEFLTPGKIFKNDELETYVERGLEQTLTNKDGISKDTKEFVKTYLQPTALGDLGLLSRQANKTLIVESPRSPNTAVIAFVLFDSWQRCFGTLDTVRLSQITNAPETLGRMFAASYDQVRTYIMSLQSLGLVNYADTQHEPVTRRFHNSPLALLEQYYQQL